MVDKPRHPFYTEVPMRKLMLKRETVRLLSDEALQYAVGGTTSETANPFCTNGTCASVGCPPETGAEHCPRPRMID